MPLDDDNFIPLSHLAVSCLWPGVAAPSCEPTCQPVPWRWSTRYTQINLTRSLYQSHRISPCIHAVGSPSHRPSELPGCQVVSYKVTSITAMFVAVVDPGTRISFLFTRCRTNCRFSIFCDLVIKYDLTQHSGTVQKSGILSPICSQSLIIIG